MSKIPFLGSKYGEKQRRTGMGNHGRYISEIQNKFHQIYKPIDTGKPDEDDETTKKRVLTLLMIRHSQYHQ